jgi:hypothetical protein
MKRIRLLVLFGIVAVALPFGLLQGVAHARSSTRSSGATGTNSVSINQYADFEDAGTHLDVGLVVTCTSTTGTGAVDVTVTQSYPYTPKPIAGGSGPQDVVCDGKGHSVAVTIGGLFFDAGKAYATADLFTTDTVPDVAAHAERWIQIRVV